MERLSKVLAQSNVASRRKAENLILEKRVKVNGAVVTDVATKVAKSDVITVDGQSIAKATPVYFLLNKPTGYVSTTSDEHNRRTILDLLLKEDKRERLYPVGRLDYDTAGLILVTNDGELTKKLTHPSFGVEKEYIARVKGIVVKSKIRDLRKGITLDDGHFALPKTVQLLELDKKNQSSSIRIVLTEGRNKEVRRIFKAIGHECKNLTRVRYDFLTLDDVPRGKYRPLKPHEVKKLYRSDSSET